ncbi:MAG: cell division protein ZapA [Ruminococcaceae bacterium]|nr:cell division protein ZapA [Oscillospiraceae bacterium]
MKQKYRITVAGTTLSLLSEDSEEYVNELAGMLDRQVTELAITKSRCSKTEALTLCALDYLDMALKLKAELEAVKEKQP